MTSPWTKLAIYTLTLTIGLGTGSQSFAQSRDNRCAGDVDLARSLDMIQARQTKIDGAQKNLAMRTEKLLQDCTDCPDRTWMIRGVGGALFASPWLVKYGSMGAGTVLSRTVPELFARAQTLGQNLASVARSLPGPVRLVGIVGSLSVVMGGAVLAMSHDATIENSISISDEQRSQLAQQAQERALGLMDTNRDGRVDSSEKLGLLNGLFAKTDKAYSFMHAQAFLDLRDLQVGTYDYTKLSMERDLIKSIALSFEREQLDLIAKKFSQVCSHYEKIESAERNLREAQDRLRQFSEAEQAVR